jgi:preprotein translocase subunit Sec63
MPELKNVKTKREAKKVYHEYVSRFHPDRATSPAQRAEFEEKMKNINPAWDEFQQSDFFTKLSQAGYWQMVAEYLMRNRAAEEA